MAPPRDDRAALIAACRAVMATHARSFDRAAAFLPPTTRDQVAVLYAFCRLVDDSVDEAPDRASAERAIATLGAELDVAAREATAATPGPAPQVALRPVVREVAPRPVVRAFVNAVADAPLALDAARALITGVAGDVGPVRIADDRALIRYCYHVAGAVGVMMCPVLGVTDPRALPFAIDLGLGMQLTNICRDVLEDARADRVYLPATRLARRNLTPEDLVSGHAPASQIAGVVAELLALADRCYASADAGLRYIPAAPRQAILVASRLYRAIGLELLHRRAGDPLRGRAYVGAAAKASWILRALAANARPAILGLTAAPTHDARLHQHLAGLPGVNAR